MRNLEAANPGKRELGEQNNRIPGYWKPEIYINHSTPDS